MRFRVLIALLGGLAVIAVFTFPVWWPLLPDDSPDELFPGLPPQLQAAFVALSPDEQAAFLQMADEDREMAVAMIQAALQPPATVVPEDQAEVAMDASEIVADGTFERVDAIHWAQGEVTIYLLPDNRKLMTFENFLAANGPDLRVVLSASEAPRTRDDVELSNLDLELGVLKATAGGQTYEIPPEVDLSLYNSVVIYCREFHVVFSTATI